MINEMLLGAALDAGFLPIVRDGSFSLFESQTNGQRFLIFFVADSLPSVEDMHETVLGKIPPEVTTLPSFKKNCDLVIVHRVQQLNEYEKLEPTILSYEEDPYHFKKYFLYFTEAEEQLLSGKDFAALSSALSDQAQFSNYKNDPRLPSLYGIAARIFIKIPFLQIPTAERDLIPLSVQLAEAVENADLSALWKRVLGTSAEDGVELLINEIVNEQLENIKNRNSGV